VWVPGRLVLGAVGYGALYVVLFLAGGIAILRRREVG